MRQSVSPAVTIAVVVCLVAVIGFFVWRTVASPYTGEKPPGIPANAAQQIGQATASGDKTAPKADSPGFSGAGANGMRGPTSGSLPVGPIGRPH